MRNFASLHVGPEDVIDLGESKAGAGQWACQWLTLRGPDSVTGDVHVHCQDADTAERLAYAFSALAALMRERAIPTVDVRALAPVEVDAA